MSRRAWLALGCMGLGMTGVVCAGIPCLVGAGIPAGFRAAAWWREVEDPATVAPGEIVEIAGEGIHLQTWGPADGRPLILVPGTSAWAETWVEVAVPLGEAGFRVVALDLPPFGYSDRPAPDGYDRTDQAARILGVVDHLGARDAVLLGHSFGGGATVQAAMDAEPGRIGHLILLDVALGLGQPDAAIAPLFGWSRIGELAAAMTLSNPAFLPTGIRSMVHDPSVVTADRVDRYRRPLTLVGTTPALGQWIPTLLAPEASAASDEAAYRALALPTTVIWGDRDTATPLAQGEHLRDLISDASLVVLPGVGHLPQLEDPSGVVGAVLAACPPAP